MKVLKKFQSKKPQLKLNQQKQLLKLQSKKLNHQMMILQKKKSLKRLQLKLNQPNQLLKLQLKKSNLLMMMNWKAGRSQQLYDNWARAWTTFTSEDEATSQEVQT